MVKLAIGLDQYLWSYLRFNMLHYSRNLRTCLGLDSIAWTVHSRLGFL